MNREKYNKKFRKFTDGELLEVYERGISDHKMAKILGSSQPCVWSRRSKLGLIAKRD